MDDRLKKRVLAFYAAGVINLLLGLYVLVAGAGFLPQSTVFWLALFFLGFAAVDFWFPRVLKKRWAEMMEKHAAEQQAKAGAGRKKAEG